MGPKQKMGQEINSRPWAQQKIKITNNNTNTNTSKKYKQNKNMRQYLNEQTLNTNDI